jgi:hypothetical protein
MRRRPRVTARVATDSIRVQQWVLRHTAGAVSGFADSLGWSAGTDLGDASRFDGNGEWYAQGDSRVLRIDTLLAKLAVRRYRLDAPVTIALTDSAPSVTPLRLLSLDGSSMLHTAGRVPGTAPGDLQLQLPGLDVHDVYGLLQRDTSGVSADYLGQLLSWMQDTEALGLFFVGPAGTCKSALAKAAGREAGVPTVAFDLGGMKGQYVGQSEQRLRQALQVVDAVGQGKVLVIATSNNIASLPPELRRRFMATFFFDLPTPEERELIWRIYEEKYQTTGERPDDTDWTGAEIKQCCSLSDTLGISKAEAANYLVPVAKSSYESIQRLRDMADGTFIAASAHGVYQKPKAASAAPKAGTRKLRAAE